MSKRKWSNQLEGDDYSIDIQKEKSLQKLRKELIKTNEGTRNKDTKRLQKSFNKTKK